MTYDCIAVTNLTDETLGPFGSIRRREPQPEGRLRVAENVRLLQRDISTANLLVVLELGARRVRREQRLVAAGQGGQHGQQPGCADQAAHGEEYIGDGTEGRDRGTKGRKDRGSQGSRDKGTVGPTALTHPFVPLSLCPFVPLPRSPALRHRRSATSLVAVWVRPVRPSSSVAATTQAASSRPGGSAMGTVTV
jgi:hypothetical protein